MSESIPLENIAVDGGTQSRATLNQTVIDEYADALAAGAAFPPVVVFYDGETHWLADGFHRFHAHRQIALAEITADIRQGTRRDAILFSVGANEAHGLRRSNEDKRRAVLTLLNDAEWQKWSDREIARRAGVGNDFVSRIRGSLSLGDSDRTYTTKHGTLAVMNTAAIGRPPTSTAPKETMENNEAEEAPVGADLRRGPKLNLPDGVNVEDIVREGLSREAAGEPIDAVAKALGIGLTSYRKAADIIALSERGGYSARDTEIVERARSLLVEDQKVTEARELIDSVASKVWGDGRSTLSRGDREPARLERFEHAFAIILQSCVSAAELELPYLTVQRARLAAREIREARRHLATLLVRIEEIHS